MYHIFHKVIRSTVPIFTFVTFLILEKKTISPLSFFFMATTCMGAIITVIYHNESMKTSVSGVVLCVLSNVASSVQMSLTAIARDKLGLTTPQTIFYTAVLIGVFIVPFIFGMNEHLDVYDFVQKNGIWPCLRVLVVGSFAVLAYTLTCIEVIFFVPYVS